MKRRLIILGADFAANGIVGQLEHDYQLLTDTASVDVPRGTIEISVESYMATYNDDVFIGSTPADITATADGGLTCSVGEPTGNIYPITIDGSAATSENSTITITQSASGKTLTVAAIASIYAIKASANAPVMAVCYANGWATSPNYMTYDEAAAVKNLSLKFQANTEITTFDELQYFTGLTAFNKDEFKNCTSLKRVIIPKNVTYFTGYVFNGCPIEYMKLPYGCIQFGSGANGGTQEHIVDVEEGWLTNFLLNGFVRNGTGSPFSNGGHLYVNGQPLTNIVVDDSVTAINSYGLYQIIADSITANKVVTLGASSIRGANCPYFEFGEDITTIESYAVNEQKQAFTLVCRATTPPSLATDLGKDATIYVPDASVDAYKAASVWSQRASKIFPISQKP